MNDNYPPMYVKILFPIVIFMSGVNVSNNLHVLIGVNNHYEAAWWKVAVSIFVAVYTSLAIYNKKIYNWTWGK